MSGKLRQERSRSIPSGKGTARMEGRLGRAAHAPRAGNYCGRAAADLEHAQCPPGPPDSPASLTPVLRASGVLPEPALLLGCLALSCCSWPRKRTCTSPFFTCSLEGTFSKASSAPVSVPPVSTGDGDKTAQTLLSRTPPLPPALLLHLPLA